jgi:serine/threonine-protein kinase RsbW
VAASSFKVRISSDPPWRILLTGEINFEDAPLIRQHADSLLESGISPLRADVSDLHFMDSSGLSALIYASHAAEKCGANLCLIGAQGQLLRLLRITGLQSLFRYEEPDGNEASVAASAEPLRELRMNLPGEPSALGVARSRLATLLHHRRIHPDDRDDIFLAMGEALANAIRHGCPAAKSGCEVSLRVVCDQDRLAIEVTDPGPGFDPDSIPAPDVTVLKDGGMGIFFMKSVMDEVEYRQDESGNTVTMIKRLSPWGEKMPPLDST